MAHTMGRALTALLVVSLTALSPSAASASARPHPPAMERFYCHRIVHPVAMHGYPWQLPNRAYCLTRLAVRGAASQTRVKSWGLESEVAPGFATYWAATWRYDASHGPRLSPEAPGGVPPLASQNASSFGS